MTTVFVSDIHGNLEALQAVLAAVDTYAPDRIICVGDVVGYGATFKVTRPSRMATIACCP